MQEQNYWAQLFSNWISTYSFFFKLFKAVLLHYFSFLSILKFNRYANMALSFTWPDLWYFKSLACPRQVNALRHTLCWVYRNYWWKINLQDLRIPYSLIKSVGQNLSIFTTCIKFMHAEVFTIKYTVWKVAAESVH